MTQDDIDKLLVDTLSRIRAKIALNINEKGLRASGKTEASMVIESDEYGARLKGRPYFQSLELGRPAGRTPRGFVYIIRQWIIDKGLAVRQIPYVRQPSERWQPKYSVEERSLLAAAGAIAHTIRTRGTLLYRQGGRRDIYTPPIQEEIARLATEIKGIISRTIAENTLGR